jgi:hypothetical protein
MDLFVRTLDQSRLFPITTDPSLFRSLYVISFFDNWVNAYNLCFPSLIGEVHINLVNKTIPKVDRSPRAWIDALCLVCNNAIDRLAADLRSARLDGMSKSSLARAIDENDPSIHVSIDEVARNISTGFGDFCDYCKNQLNGTGDGTTTTTDTVPRTDSLSDGDRSSNKEGELTIENVDAIDKRLAKKERDERAQKNMDFLVRELGISNVTFWFMIYLIYNLDEERFLSTMDYLRVKARGSAILSDDTYTALERWRITDRKILSLGKVNLEAMVFIMMYYRPH